MQGGRWQQLLAAAASKLSPMSACPGVVGLRALKELLDGRPMNDYFLAGKIKAGQFNVLEVHTAPPHRRGVFPPLQPPPHQLPAKFPTVQVPLLSWPMLQ